MTTATLTRRVAFGIVGGSASLAAADLLRKMHDASQNRDAQLNVIVDARDDAPILDPIERKLRAFDAIRDFEQRGVTTVALPCFESHRYIDELQQNTPLIIVDMIAALFAHIQREWPSVRRIGVLASRAAERQRVFERYTKTVSFDIVYACPDKRTPVRDACDALIEQGAELILPANTDLALSVTEIARTGRLAVPLIDAHSVYAQHLLATGHIKPSRHIKLGVVGGVGPAATVDFVAKVVRHTPATRDQDHIKLIVEQNPQIPDRTAHLTGNGSDPTLALYATCKRLEDGGADFIAIPCNTAHAFIAPIESRLRIPIVSMMKVTADHLRRTFPSLRRVGLLATTGTIVSGVYRKALEASGLTEVLPSEALQERVMNSIYGTCGVKAGLTKGECVDDIMAAVDELMLRDVDVILLACTELPLLFPEASTVERWDRTAQLVDPTEILAKTCVALASGNALPIPHEAVQAQLSVDYSARVPQVRQRPTFFNADRL